MMQRKQQFGWNEPLNTILTGPGSSSLDCLQDLKQLYQTDLNQGTKGLESGVKHKFENDLVSKPIV